MGLNKKEAKGGREAIEETVAGRLGGAGERSIPTVEIREQ